MSSAKKIPAASPSPRTSSPTYQSWDIRLVRQDLTGPPIEHVGMPCFSVPGMTEDSLQRYKAYQLLGIGRLEGIHQSAMRKIGRTYVVDASVLVSDSVLGQVVEVQLMYLGCSPHYELSTTLLALGGSFG